MAHRLLFNFVSVFVLASMVGAAGGPPEVPVPPEPPVPPSVQTERLPSEELVAPSQTSDFPYYEEIIIKDGKIEVRTDSGLVQLSEEDLLAVKPLEETGQGGRDREDITSWGKDIVIGEGEQVRANIVVISADLTVNGYVDGDMAVFGGNLYLNSTAYVEGDVVCIGGRVEKEEGAKIIGSSIGIGGPLAHMPGGSPYQIIQGILLVIMIFGLIFGGLAISLLSHGVGRIAGKLATHPVKSFILGYVVYVGAFIVWVLLLVSVIGIPLALVGQPVAFLGLMVLGYASLSLVIGSKIFKVNAPSKAYWYGTFIISGAPSVLLAMGLIMNSLPLFVVNLILLAFLIFVILPFGLGASLLAKFGLAARAKPEASAALGPSTGPVQAS